MRPGVAGAVAGAAWLACHLTHVPPPYVPRASDASYAVWTQHAAAIPFEPRRGYMMTAVGTKLIVAGGTMDDPDATGSGPAPRIYHENVYVIDVAAGTPTWTELASGSVFGRTDAAMVTVDGRVFFGFGGIASSSVSYIVAILPCDVS